MPYAYMDIVVSVRSRCRESAVELVAWTPSQRRAESQSNRPQRSAVPLSAASEESPTSDAPASTSGSAQVRREKENAEGGTSAKRSRKEHPCVHCGMTGAKLVLFAPVLRLPHDPPSLASFYRDRAQLNHPWVHSQALASGRNGFVRALRPGQDV